MILAKPLCAWWASFSLNKTGERVHQKQRAPQRRSGGDRVGLGFLLRVVFLGGGGDLDGEVSLRVGGFSMFSVVPTLAFCPRGVQE
jgi:hypothetical protein